MQYNIEKVFSFLPLEKIKASELNVGNIICLHSRWELIINISLEDKDYNNGYCLILSVLNGGTLYFQPDHEISIVRRDLINNTEMMLFINAHIVELEELRKLADEEEQEQIEQEKNYLRRRLESLKD